ncbi:hypothetical protein VNI00_002487 [Paramarasmius palmivorus]|uniref:Uncharacterized protein n=1 Tax=Paramarasmius palmivorus TaxID=297713 RepID=A0AAW0DXM4_9AGAR
MYDPIMAHFPLALAIEPRLLPYAVANGFYMDRKYRDFVFRKMFENASASDRKAEDIVQNVIELCRLDSTMFLSRTVAAEVCVEARANEVGFSALKRLNAGGHLLFDLPTLVADLLKLFLKTRSVITTNMQNVIRYLYSEFPSSDPSVRLVVLLTIFFPADSWNVPVATIKARLEELDFGPVTRQDLYNLLMHPFTDRCESVLSYMLKEMESDHGKTGLSEKEIEQVANDVALRLIEVDCKGKMLRKLRESYPSVHKTISRATLDNHQINLDDLPQPDDVEQCSRFRTKLCRDNHFGPTDFIYLWDGNTTAQESSSRQCGNNESEVENKSHTGSDGDGAETRELGEIGQESLTAMIRNDELSSPVRNRRRISYFSSYTDLFSHLPLDFVQVGRWVKGDYGSKNRVTAIFMTHAILNDNLSTLRDLLMESHSSPVPITFKHFQMLARLGRSINYHIVAYLLGCPEFYFTEEEYISQYSPTKRTDGSNGKKVKSHSSITLPQVSVLIEQTPTFSKGRKRPRRSAANTVQSYAIPDDDEDEMNIVQAVEDVKPLDVKQRKEAANLQTWIKHLGDLLKTEQARLRQRKRQWEEQNPGTSVSDKNLFVKSLSAHLRLLRKHNREKYGHLPKETEFTPEEYDDDGEYIYRATRSAKKART